MYGKITFTKIVATPTRLGWSQAYNAGNLGILLSLKNNGLDKENSEDHSFSSIGRNILKNIEIEYFSLEDKKLDAISKIAKEALSSIPSHITPSLLIITIVDDIAYLILSG